MFVVDNIMTDDDYNKLKKISIVFNDEQLRKYLIELRVLCNEKLIYNNTNKIPSSETEKKTLQRVKYILSNFVETCRPSNNNKISTPNNNKRSDRQFAKKETTTVQRKVTKFLRNLLSKNCKFGTYFKYVQNKGKGRSRTTQKKPNMSFMQKGARRLNTW